MGSSLAKHLGLKSDRYRGSEMSERAKMEID